MRGRPRSSELTNLINIFASPQLDFSQNRAEHDDILGDAYEYLMWHFATESGKSKGQFYTPAEVSRVIAKVIGISPQNTKASTTAYDPTCGSGSLLLKVAAEAGKHITLEGQEKDVTTAGLARMNMILHDFPTANIVSGNTLAAPKFKEGRTAPHLRLRRRQSAVLRQDLDDRSHAVEGPLPALRLGRAGHQTGRLRLPAAHHPLDEELGQRRLHPAPRRALPRQCRSHDPRAARSFRLSQGHHRAARRTSFTAPASPPVSWCSTRRTLPSRKGVFMIDASKGFRKDGPKNRLREQDIHKIVDTFTRQAEVPGYARMVPLKEIADPKTDFNLNLPRYIDSTEPKDLQDIDGHLRGGIPERDLDALGAYWKVLPSVRGVLFESADRPGYGRLKPALTEVKRAIFKPPRVLRRSSRGPTKVFADWRTATTPRLTGFGEGRPTPRP